MHLNFTMSDQNIEIIGKVVENLPMDEIFQEVTIQFGQFIKEEWEKLLESFEKNQDLAFEAMEKMKSGQVKDE